MKQVDRPPNNPKRITIQSSQECFSVDIPSAEQPNPCPEVGNPPNVDSQNLTNETVQIDSDEDDFMPALKKRNVSESHTRVLRKVVTKRIKHEELPRQRLNVRCNPQDVIASINILNERQREAIRRKGFSTILDMTVDALCSRSHLQWLMDKLDPKDMTIRPGPGKELKITKDIVHLILGVPNHGGGKPLGIDEAVAASNLRAELGVAKDEFNVTFLQDRLRKGEDDDLSIRCFFLILFNRLLFPTASWGITYHEVLLTEELHRFHEIDWCQLIFNDLCEAAKKWHNRITTNVSTTIYGCSIVVLLYYLDHLHTTAAPQNKTGTPRIKFFDKNSIKALTKADKRKLVTHSHYNFISSSEARQRHAMQLDLRSIANLRTNIFDALRPAPMPRPTFNIKLPSIKEMMSSKINDLPHRHRSKFIDILAAYDLEVDKSCVAIKDSIDKIIEKQYDIADKFIELIDEVLRAESENLENETDELQQPGNSADSAVYTATFDL
ncbi:uncharacterized protein [Zea mays]|uniref:uncharacterized protein n=1 Tax=Zea mays TaxID=4577 RepID=UPI0004DEB2FF|nr:uncharacterized protein LOC118473194 [Zea mays]